MKTFFLLLLLLVAGFAFWKYSESGLPSIKGSDNTITHVVKKGDTLSSIARTYKTSITSIKKRNNLNQDIIHIGDQLTILHGEQAVVHSTQAQKESPPKKTLPKNKPPKTLVKKELPKSTIMETSNIGIDINAKNQVYLKNKDGKFSPAGTIIYGSNADANGMEIKTVTYRDLKGKETTLPGAAAPEAVIRLALKKK